MILSAFLCVLLSTFWTFHSQSSVLSCSVTNQHGLKEWLDNQPLETVIWEPNKVCHNHKTCYGPSFSDNNDLAQILPVLTQPQAIIRFQSSSSTIKHYFTNENGFKNCRFNVENVVADSSNVHTVPGSNYFIATDTEKPWITCQAGQRVNITVLSFNCSSSFSSPSSSLSSPSTHCNGMGKCLASPYQSSFRCSCCEKYVGDYCEKVDGCASNETICHNGGYCNDGPDISNTLSHFTCHCSEGFTGPTCREEDTGKCSRNECMNGGECSEDERDINGYTCQCAGGYTGKTCEQEVNECLSSPCKNGGKCSDGVNKYTCECVEGFIGDSCEEDMRPCRDGVCKNGGTCDEVDKEVNENGTICFCQIGFSSFDCSVQIMSCLPNPCQHSTECTAYNDNTFECTCKAGYIGKRCDTLFNSSHCVSSPCKDGSKCEDISNGYQCRCDDGIVRIDCKNAEQSANETFIIKTQSNSQTPSSSTPPYAFIVIGIVIIIIILIFLILLLLFLHKRKSPPPYQPYSVSGGIPMNSVNPQKTASSPEELFQDDEYPDESVSYSTSTLSSNVSSERTRNTEFPVFKRNITKNVVA